MFKPSWQLPLNIFLFLIFISLLLMQYLVVSHFPNGVEMHTFLVELASCVKNSTPFPQTLPITLPYLVEHNIDTLPFHSSIYFFLIYPFVKLLGAHWGSVAFSACCIFSGAYVILRTLTVAHIINKNQYLIYFIFITCVPMIFFQFGAAMQEPLCFLFTSVISYLLTRAYLATDRNIYRKYKAIALVVCMFSIMLSITYALAALCIILIDLYGRRNYLAAVGWFSALVLIIVFHLYSGMFETISSVTMYDNFLYGALGPNNTNAEFLNFDPEMNIFEWAWQRFAKGFYQLLPSFTFHSIFLYLFIITTLFGFLIWNKTRDKITSKLWLILCIFFLPLCVHMFAEQYSLSYLTLAMPPLFLIFFHMLNLFADKNKDLFGVPINYILLVIICILFVRDIFYARELYNSNKLDEMREFDAKLILRTCRAEDKIAIFASTWIRGGLTPFYMLLEGKTLMLYQKSPKEANLKTLQKFNPNVIILDANLIDVYPELWRGKEYKDFSFSPQTIGMKRVIYLDGMKPLPDFKQTADNGN